MKLPWLKIKDIIHLGYKWQFPQIKMQIKVFAKQIMMNVQSHGAQDRGLLILSCYLAALFISMKYLTGKFWKGVALMRE